MRIEWQEVVTTLGSSVILIAAMVYVVKSVFEHFLQRNLKHAESNDRKAEQDQLRRLNREDARIDRIREELFRWSNPILGSVKALSKRLENVLNHEGHLGLSPNCKDQVNPNWSITYDYFMSSTVYLFCQYFCYLELLRENLRFEIFQDHAEKDLFFDKSREVEKALSSFPHKALDSLPHEGDMQVFSLQQRMLGEIVTVRDRDVDRCMKYSEFLVTWKEAESNVAFTPLVEFLRGLNDTNERRWRRLELMKAALDDLYKECERLISWRQRRPG